MKDWIPAPEAELVRRTEKGILLRLRSGREEWFPRSGVVQTDEGWFVAGWLYESRRKSKVDTSCMRARGGCAEGWFLVLVLLLTCTWISIVQVHISLTPRFVAVNQHNQE